MTVTTRIHEALGRVQRERRHVGEELNAYERFAESVRETDPVRAPASSGVVAARGGGSVPSISMAPRNRSTTTSAERVRERFAETVYPHSDEGGSIDEVLAAELGEEIATTLAPTSVGRFTPEVQTAIRSAVDRRRAELRAMERALETEAESLETTRTGVEPILEWLADADERPLLDFGFDELHERHRLLDDHRARCDALARERQSVLRGTTSHDGAAGLAHQTLVEHLSRNVETTYPVLATVTRLDELCKECQRAVRDHLTRRV